MPTPFIKKHTSEIIKKPRITEKASLLAESNVYVFEIAKDATKNSVAKSIISLYKVTPVRVNIVNIPPKNVLIRGKQGIKSGVKKAYVYLKKGDKIDTL